MKEALSVLAALIMLYGFVPYSRDIIAGKVRPARSTRLMMVLLVTISLLQQHSLGSGWLLAVTAGDAIGAVAILILAIKRGVGGFKRLDLTCYALLTFDVILWLGTGSALIAIHLSILADLIAMTPVLSKTWLEPWTETPLFFLTGVVGPILNIIAVGDLSYQIIIFPVYLAGINLLEALLIIYRQRIVQKPRAVELIDHQPLG